MSDNKQDNRPAYTEDGIRIHYNYGDTPIDEDGWCYIGGKMHPLKIVNVNSDTKSVPVQIGPPKKIKTHKRCM
jgi:hypothetical protein